MMPLAPMVQELGCDEDKANDQFPTDELRSFTSSQFRFSISVYISRSWSEPTGTDMIDQHCTIILASGSLRNVFTCRNINNNNKNIDRTAIFDDYGSKVTESRNLFRLPFLSILVYEDTQNAGLEECF